jgi:hypothetical protein
MTTALIISPSPAMLPDPMIQRRAGAGGIATKIGNHTFRATGIAAYPFSRCFEGMPAFGSPLVLLSLLVNLLVSGTAVSASCGGSIRLGLMVLGEFIRTIYHEVEIHENGAFDLISHCLSLL